MFCNKCGQEIEDTVKFCPNCGQSVEAAVPGNQNTRAPQNWNGMRCPKCGGANIDIQMYQEQTGGAAVTKTKYKFKEKDHGCLWWMLIGWWWWIIDLMLWICIFPLRLLIQLFISKKYVGDSNTVSSTKNSIRYKTVCLCKSCGYHWEK